MGLFDFIYKGNREPGWKSALPKEMADMLLAEIKSNPQACTSNEIPEGIGRFGLDKTNPIPIFGIPDNENYLSKIRTKNGERVRWRRIGSSEISNILKPIDAYELFDAAGNTIAVFYLSPYHLITSNKAPENFKISY
jgi:hypothetical protein